MFLAVAVRIHCAWIKKHKASFLLIGSSGAGKTTLARLWLQGNKDDRLLEGDDIFVTLDNNVASGFSFSLNVLQPVSHLFFVVRNKKGLSKIMPIAPKEAFTRIVFNSDTIFKNRRSEAKVHQRLNILKNLVTHCKSFLLINGDDLRDNAVRLQSFIQNAL